MTTLFQLTGKVNAASWRFFAEKECLFMGAKMSQRGVEDVEATFDFAGSANRVNFAVGDITVAQKYGWEYMWVRYQDSVSNLMMVKTPVGVYCEEVYETADFTLLGLG
jgi:hypothetical protein